MPRIMNTLFCLIFVNSDVKVKQYIPTHHKIKDIIEDMTYALLRKSVIEPGEIKGAYPKP